MYELNGKQKSSPMTAVVEFIGEGFIKEIEYAYIDNTKIYNLIEKKRDINLKKVFLSGFSIRQYKKERNLDTYEDVALKSFSAEECFLDNGFDISITEIKSNIVSFSDTVFAGDFIDFRMVTFTGEDIRFFNNTFFRATVEFSEASFTGECYFTWCKFIDSQAYFRSLLVQDCDFVFIDVILTNSDAIFEGPSFINSNITFIVKQIGTEICNIIFTGMSCEKGRYDFSGNAVAGTLAFKGCYIDNSLVLRGVHCSDLLIEGCTILGLLDLNSQQSNHVSFNSISLINSIVSDKIYLDWEMLNIKKAIIKQKGTTNKEKANQFLMLKENYSSLGLYEYEDEAYVEFKRQQRKGKLKYYFSRNPIILYILRLIISPLYLLYHFMFRYLLVDLIGKYATSPLRVTISMLLSIMLFSVPYYILIDFSGMPFHPIFSSIYFSFVSFLTIGNTGIQAVPGMGMILTAIEGFIGIFLMTYFTTAVVRKVLR